MPQPLQVGTRTISSTESPFVIAEVGVNHNGDLGMARALVQVAAESGADAVKFQTFDPSKLVSSNAALAPYQERDGLESQQQLLDGLVMPTSWFEELAPECASAGVMLMSTPFDVDSARLLAGVGVVALKISSGDLTYLPMLEEIAQLQVPMILSTGMGCAAEVEAACEATKDAEQVGLMHCVSAYPAPLDQCNLRCIPSMRDHTRLQVGWSDHTLGSVAAVTAVALGATMFEKHITLDQSLPGPDHAASADPPEMARYVRDIRSAHSALGEGTKEPVDAEKPNMITVRRSWHAKRDLPVGHTVTDADIVGLRPMMGIGVDQLVVGRTLARAVAAGSAISHDSVALA